MSEYIKTAAELQAGDQIGRPLHALTPPSSGCYERE